MTTLLILNNLIPAHYEANNRPVYPNAGVLQMMSDNNAKVFEAYNNLIDELVSDEEWIENRVHIDGRNKVYNGKYQLSASTVYILDDTTKSITVELKLNPKNNKPKALLLSYGNRAGNTDAHTVNIELATLEQLSAKDMKAFINAGVEDLLARIVPENMACRVMVLDPQFFHINHIKDKFLSRKIGAVANPEIIGFGVDNRNPLMFVGYEQDGETGIKEIEIYSYLESLVN